MQKVTFSGQSADHFAFTMLPATCMLNKHSDGVEFATIAKLEW